MSPKKPTVSLRKILSRSDLTPGFYDLPDFIALERINPNVLEEYASYVLNRTRPAGEDERVRHVLNSVEASLSANSTLEERLGNCLHVSMAVMKMLELEGIWSFILKGSLEVKFDPELGLSAQRFWQHDVGTDFAGGFMGHAWLVVPPFAIVDFTAGTQRWQNGEAKHLPNHLVLEESQAPKSAPLLELFHADPRHRPRAFSEIPIDCLQLWRVHPPRLAAINKAKLTYQPYGVGAPDAALAKMVHPVLGGLSPIDFYERHVKPRI